MRWSSYLVHCSETTYNVSAFPQKFIDDANYEDMAVICQIQADNFNRFR